MKLYLISQAERNDYDTYDSAVVAAETETAARNTHPSGNAWPVDQFYGTWCKEPSAVTVVYLGKAKAGTGSGVICASFNAG